MDTTKSDQAIAVYGGYLDDNDKLMKSTSGGIATALAEQMIDNGGYVAGVVYSADFRRAEYILTKEKADLERMKGSKYIDTAKKDIYKKVKETLEQGEKVLFIGLPCTVAALYLSLGSRPENLLSCELICHGPTDIKVHEEYLDYLEKKYNSKIVDFSVRRKKYEWVPTYLFAHFENGKVFSKPFNDTEYGYACSVLGKPGCYSCKFKGKNRKGDIMIGDFWGVSEKDVYWNPKGVSAIFAETDKGYEVLNSLPSIKLFPAEFEKAVKRNPMVVQTLTKEKQSDKFAQLLEEKGLMYAAKHCLSTKQRIVSAAKRCIPQSIRPRLKAIYHSLIRY